MNVCVCVGFNLEIKNKEKRSKQRLDNDNTDLFLIIKNSTGLEVSIVMNFDPRKSIPNQNLQEAFPKDLRIII